MVTKKTPAKKSARAGGPAKKTTAKKPAAKKRTATKATAKKATAKVAVKKRTVPKTAAAPPSVSKGTISSWNPSMGQGTVKIDSGHEFDFDLNKTAIENEGYVDLYVGRNVEFSPAQKNSQERLKAV